MPLVGNPKALQILDRLATSGRFGNALLFTGPEGIGKRQIARDFAFRLMCFNEQGEIPNARHKWESGNHPDLHLYAPTGKAALHAVEQMRQFGQEVFLPPLEAPRKVFIIDEADRMAPASANALLKTFEEPTLDAVILLISSAPEGILPTILSRVMTLSFEPVSEAEICRLLQERGLKEEEALRLAQRARGSVSRALDLIENEAIDQELVSLLAEPHTTYFDLKKGIDKLADQMEKVRAKLSKDDEELGPLHFQRKVEGWLAEIVYWYRDLAVLQAKPAHDNGVSLYHPEAALAKGMRSVPIAKVLKATQEAKIAIARFSKLSACLEALFLQLGAV